MKFIILWKEKKKYDLLLQATWDIRRMLNHFILQKNTSCSKENNSRLEFTYCRIDPPQGNHRIKFREHKVIPEFSHIKESFCTQQNYVCSNAYKYWLAE